MTLHNLHTDNTLVPEDISFIASLSGYDQDYVRKVTEGKEENNVIDSIVRDMLAMRGHLTDRYKGGGNIQAWAEWPEIERHCAKKLLEPLLDQLSNLDMELRKYPGHALDKKVAQIYAQLETHGRWLSRQRLLIQPRKEAITIVPVLAYSLLNLRGLHANRVNLNVEPDTQIAYTDPVLLSQLVRTMVYCVSRVVLDPQLDLDIADRGDNEICISIAGSSALEKETMNTYTAMHLDKQEENGEYTGLPESLAGRDLALCRYLAQILGGHIEWQQETDHAVLCAVLPVGVCNKNS